MSTCPHCGKPIARGTNDKVSLGCGTLVLIAIIVAIFSGDKSTDRIERSLSRIDKRLERLEDPNRVVNFAEHREEFSACFDPSSLGPGKFLLKIRATNGRLTNVFRVKDGNWHNEEPSSKPCVTEIFQRVSLPGSVGNKEYDIPINVKPVP